MRYPFLPYLLLWFLLAALAIQAKADVSSIALNNNTFDTAALENALTQQLQNTGESDLQIAAQNPLSADWNIYPIKTDGLTSGSVNTSTINLPQLTQPVFLIGNDEQSYAWLQQHAARLQALHAMGFLVNADNSNDKQRLTEIADGLTIVPLNGAAFARQFHLTHYPILISAQGIEQ